MRKYLKKETNNSYKEGIGPTLSCSYLRILRKLERMCLLSWFIGTLTLVIHLII